MLACSSCGCSLWLERKRGLRSTGKIMICLFCCGTREFGEANLFLSLRRVPNSPSNKRCSLTAYWTKGFNLWCLPVRSQAHDMQFQLWRLVLYLGPWLRLLACGKRTTSYFPSTIWNISSPASLSEGGIHINLPNSLFSCRQ